MKRIGGNRRKTRSLFRKSVKDKGKVSLNKYFQEFNQGDQVYLVANPTIQKGLYFRRFHGKAGKITGKQGTNYFVEIKDGNKLKKVLTHPIHLKKS